MIQKNQGKQKKRAFHILKPPAAGGGTPDVSNSGGTPAASGKAFSTTGDGSSPAASATGGDSSAAGGPSGFASKDRSNGLSRKEQRRYEARQHQKKYNRLKPLKKKMDPLEQHIERKEARKDEIEALMAEPDFYDDNERVKELTLEYDKLKAELVEKYASWEELALQISEIEEEFSS